MTGFQKKLEAAKRSSTLHLLFKCSRILNERAIASLPKAPSAQQPRPAHLALFAHIDLESGTRMTDLADKLGITKQAVSQLVDDLEQMGSLARIADANDGRAKRVIFTRTGKATMLEGLAHLKAVEQQLSRALGKDVMASLRQALLVLHDHLAP